MGLTKNRVLLAAITVMFLLTLPLSCAHSQQFKLETATNQYITMRADYEDTCHPMSSLNQQVPCRDWFVALNITLDDIQTASRLNAKVGGDLTLQLTKIRQDFKIATAAQSVARGAAKGATK